AQGASRARYPSAGLGARAQGGDGVSPLEHIPGIRREPPPEPSPDRRGIGVLGLHEGRTLLVALERCRFARAVAGCDLDPRKIEEAREVCPDVAYTQRY